MTTRVFVPLVGPDGNGQQMFEALAGPTPPDPHPARLTPQISELHDFGLYRTGQLAREAVTRFTDVRRDRVWLGRRNARVGPWYLRISDLQVGRISDENARSAGLGLTTAALLEAFGLARDVVFATGEIRLPQGPGAVGRVEVAPVEGIRGKLSLIGDYVEQHRSQLAGASVTVLLPSTTPDGQPLADSEARLIGRIRAAGEAAGLPVTFHFLETLDDLEPVFGPFVARPRLDVRKAVAGSTILLAAAVLAATWAWIVSAPVALAWRAVDGSADGDALPRRAVYRADTDRLELLPTCYDAQRQPVVLGGETLVLRVSAEDTRPLAGLLAPARYFIASVSREGYPIVLDASLFRTSGSGVRPGALEDAVAAVPVEAADDEIRLFVVATRDRDASLSGLAEELRARLEGLDGASALATSAQFLSDRFDGQIDYQFRVTTDASACPISADG